MRRLRRDVEACRLRIVLACGVNRDADGAPREFAEHSGKVERLWAQIERHEHPSVC